MIDRGGTTQRFARALAGTVLVLALAVSGCTAAAPSATAEAILPTPSAVTPKASPTPALTPIAYYSVTKNGEGEHGGVPPIDLPADVAIEYIVSGTCEFVIVVADTGGDPTDPGWPKLSVDVTGPEVSGIWRLKLVPGFRSLSTRDVGCVYSLTVRAVR